MPKNCPHLLYIHSDQHSPAVLGRYGDAVVNTPNLNRLAASGVVFNNVYCPSLICVPSRMSSLTGLHPFQNKVWTNCHMLRSDIPTLAHSLGAAGHHPVLIGRMHSVGPDQLHGYAERLVGDHGPNSIGGASADRGMLSGAQGPGKNSLRLSGEGQSGYEAHDEDVVSETISYLKSYTKKEMVKHEPFCLTVGFMLPHPPYVARKQFYSRYVDKVSMPAVEEAFTDQCHSHIKWWHQTRDIMEVSKSETIRARTAYWALVEELDSMIGKILHALESESLLENTLVIYTSDHGDMLGEHSLWWKHVFYEESVKAPLIISWPGKLPRRKRCQHVVSSLDVTATILDAMQSPALPGSIGRSLLSLFDSASPDDVWEDIAFSEYCSDEYGPSGGCFQRMVRKDDWKFIYYDNQPPQLFNLKEDPHEFVDFSTDNEYSATLRKLEETVMADWNPEMIKSEMKFMNRQGEMLESWAKNVIPRDAYCWKMDSKMSYLS